jgi:ABC-type lipoprotein release transport system permease subunit
MRHPLAVARTGLDAVCLHPLRSTVTVAALIVILLPFLVGVALADGLAAEAEAAARSGADLYVAGSQFGRPVPIPLTAVAKLRQIDGVTAVVPRIVGEVALGKDAEPAVMVGLPPDQFPAWAANINGAAPGGRQELVVGPVLAHRLHLTAGSMIPPFYRNDREGERVSRVVGVLRPDAPRWQSRLVLTSFDTAAAVFDQRGLATDLLVTCRPGYEAAVSRSIQHELVFPSATGDGSVRVRVMTRDVLLARLPRGVRQREGAFALHFVLAFVVGVLVVLITSGVGLTERRREVGILKATGWQTDEVLLRGFAESVALGLVAAALAVLLAWGWLGGLNGYGVAAVFLLDDDMIPGMAVPYRLAPVPVLLGVVLALALVLSGTLYATWRAAIAAPLDAIR